MRQMHAFIDTRPGSATLGGHLMIAPWRTGLAWTRPQPFSSAGWFRGRHEDFVLAALPGATKTTLRYSRLIAQACGTQTPSAWMFDSASRRGGSCSSKVVGPILNIGPAT